MKSKPICLACMEKEILCEIKLLKVSWLGVCESCLKVDRVFEIEVANCNVSPVWEDLVKVGEEEIWPFWLRRR